MLQESLVCVERPSSLSTWLLRRRTTKKRGMQSHIEKSASEGSGSPVLRQVRGEQRKRPHRLSPDAEVDPSSEQRRVTHTPTSRGGQKDDASRRGGVSNLQLSFSHAQKFRTALAQVPVQSLLWSSSWEMMVIRFWRPKMKPLSWPSCTTLSSP